MDYTQHSEAPDSFHFWTGVSAIAGALRRQVWIDQGYFDWVPNFYIILVAPPGVVSKSTTTSIGMRLLRQIPSIHFGPQVITWQALIKSMGEACDEVPMPDGTFLPMSCLTIESGEFGTFLNPNDREMIDVLTSLWDGRAGVWDKVTKTQGSDAIQNPWINIISCTTPTWIYGNLPEHMIGGGFTSRCILVYADKKRRLVAYPGEALPPNFKQQEAALVHDLEMISMLRGEYKLDADAKAWGTEWYRRHYEAKHENISGSALDGYLARKQTHIHKLAMVLAASQHSELIIRKEELIAASDIITSLEGDMHKVFSSIARGPEAQKADELVSTVKRYGSLSKANLLRLLFRKMSYNQFSEALQSAIMAGLVAQVGGDGQIMIKYIGGE